MDRTAALLALQRADLCLILTRSLCFRDPVAVLRASLAHGAGLVQIREKDCPPEELRDWVRTVHRDTQGAGVPLIVNDDPALALATGAEGVHVGALDPEPSTIRNLQGGADLLLGVSCHSRHELEMLTPLADYAGLGALFETTTRTASISCPLAALATEATPRPVFGIGGIRLATLSLAVAAGLRRAAVSSAICGATDPGHMTHALRNILAGRSDAGNARTARLP